VIDRRRALVLGGVAGLLGLGFAGSAAALDDDYSVGVRARRILGWTGIDGTVPAAPANGPSVVVTSRRVHSTARGTDVNLITVVPAARPAGQLPVCLLLHGRYMNAASMVGLGMPNFLEAAIRAGAPPFAMAAVDGGNSYWLARRAGDDPQAMLRTEMPGWLGGFGLSAGGGVPTAVLGISMGCFGALVYARSVARAPTLALLSPALFRSWADARSVHAFASQTAWSAAEPLRHPGPPLRLGVWCGREDPFYPAARQLIAQRHPAMAHLDHGAHTPGYWRRVLPEALRFIAAPHP
jgi:S-formylglutathione hydrolase FrmB